MHQILVMKINFLLICTILLVNLFECFLCNLSITNYSGLPENSIGCGHEQRICSQNYLENRLQNLGNLLFFSFLPLKTDGDEWYTVALKCFDIHITLGFYIQLIFILPW